MIDRNRSDIDKNKNIGTHKTEVKHIVSELRNNIKWQKQLHYDIILWGSTNMKVTILCVFNRLK